MKSLSAKPCRRPNGTRVHSLCSFTRATPLTPRARGEENQPVKPREISDERDDPEYRRRHPEHSIWDRPDPGQPRQ